MRCALPLLALAACAPAEQPPAEPAAPERVATAEGFATPESVIYDAAHGVWFVTNINGNPSQKDNNGFISRLRADGTVDSLRFIAGGQGGVTLHAPKGQAIVGDTLWVTDIDAVRGFHTATGAPLAEIPVAGARFLNDIAAGPDGALYVTDTGIEFGPTGEMQHPGPDRVWRLAGREVSVALEGGAVALPNGITWDVAGQRFILVSFGGPELLSWTPGGDPTPMGSGPGSHDGVVLLPDGRFLVSSWADSTVFVGGAAGPQAVIQGVPSPADIGADPAGSRVAIPLFMDNRVEIWSIPPS